MTYDRDRARAGGRGGSATAPRKKPVDLFVTVEIESPIRIAFLTE